MAESLQDRLIGTWQLVKYTMKDEQGKEYFPLGKDCEGFLIYTADGFVSAQLTASGRPVYQSGDLHKGTPEEMAAAAAGYMAYAGWYRVDEEKQTLTHQMKVSMNPTWLGQIQERYLAIEGDMVSITAAVNTAVLVWKKAGV
ncbi:MAG: lipocalin-like domain-containing protein [Desulfopila sp.]